MEPWGTQALLFFRVETSSKMFSKSPLPDIPFWINLKVIPPFDLSRKKVVTSSPTSKDSFNSKCCYHGQEVIWIYVLNYLSNIVLRKNLQKIHNCQSNNAKGVYSRALLSKTFSLKSVTNLPSWNKELTINYLNTISCYICHDINKNLKVQLKHQKLEIKQHFRNYNYLIKMKLYWNAQ